MGIVFIWWYISVQLHSGQGHGGSGAGSSSPKVILALASPPTGMVLER